MRKMMAIALNDLLIFLKDPGALIGAFLIPVVFSVFLGLGMAGSDGPSQIRVDVIDNDQSELSARFMDDLRQANAALVLCPFDNDEGDYCQMGDDPALTEERAVNRLSNNTSLALIEIPQGFEASLETGEATQIGYRSNENAAAPGYILQAVQAVTQRMGTALAAATMGVNTAEGADLIAPDDTAARDDFRQAVYERASGLLEPAPFSVDYQETVQDPSTQVSGTQRGFGQSVPGMASMFVTFFVLLSAPNLIRERKNWTLQRLIVMPVARWQVIGGKILMYFLLGMLQFLVMFAAGRILGLNLGNDLIALVLIMASLTLCMTAFGLLMATFIKTEMQGAAMLNLLGLTLAPLGGAWWPLDIVPDFMRVVGHISPIAWAMDGFNKLLFQQGTLGDVLVEMGVLLALALVFFVVAIARFKYE